MSLIKRSIVQLKVHLSRLEKLVDSEPWSNAQAIEAKVAIDKKDMLEKQFLDVISDGEVPIEEKEFLTAQFDKFYDMTFAIEARIRLNIQSIESVPPSSYETLSESSQSPSEIIRVGRRDMYASVRSLVEDRHVNETIQRSSPHLASASNLYNYDSPNAQRVINAQGGDPTRLKLPAIELPKFSDGTDTTWTSFSELFTALIIENDSVTPIRKLHYLRSALSGEPLRLIAALAITSENFDIAWATLQRKYNDVRSISNGYWNRIVEHPSIGKDKATLSEFVTTIRTNLDALRALKHPVDSWSFILTNLIMKKVDPRTRELFEAENTSDYPNVEDVLTFLEKRVKALKAASLYQTEEEVKTPTSKPTAFKNKKPSHRYSLVTRTVTCVKCKGDHPLENCSEFLRWKPKERFRFVKDSKLCLFCLGSDHRTPVCPSKARCSQCNEKHHQLLHFPVEPRNDATVTVSAQNQNTSTSLQPSHSECSSHHVQFAIDHDSKKSNVLLGTAIVAVKDRWGNDHLARALMDMGSQCSFITRALVERLRLPRRFNSVKVKGIACQPIESGPDFSVRLELGVKDAEEPWYRTEAICVNEITGLMPTRTLPVAEWDHIFGLNLADPGFASPQRVDILIGADLIPAILTGSKREGRKGSPIALSTTFGYILVGPVSDIVTKEQEEQSRTHHVVYSCNATLEEAIHRLWEFDKIPDKIHVTPEDEYCEKLFARECRRDPTGRYIVPLMFRPDEPELGESRAEALKRLYAMENKFKKDPWLYHEYVNFMNGYFESGYAEPVKIVPSKANFLPHHGVIKKESQTTKLRVVFDASCRTSNGRSLNDTLFAGPKLQQEITSVLIRFRLEPIAMVADVEKMFCQIKVTEEGSANQCFLWRKTPNEPIRTFKLVTVAFGVTCSPFLALRTLQQLCKDEGTSYLRASEIIQSHIYVDDCLFSCKSLQEASELRQELCELLAKGGFRLRKWMTNKPELLETIPEQDRQSQKLTSFDETPLVKILGLSWDSADDCFTYQTSNRDHKLTKRGILAETARIFDPLGWLAPALLPARCLLKELWNQGLDWDDPAPQDLASVWKRFLDELTHFTRIKLERPFYSEPGRHQYIINGFADASSKAYACVVYITVVDFRGKNKSFLLMAKSRVTPVRKVSTIPRLELQSAVLLAQLVRYVLDVFKNKLPISDIRCWSDSAVALHWIAGHPSRWQTFVANRVDKIQELTEISWWSHIRSEQNPADCATRGLLPSELASFQLWWNGPEFIANELSTWPIHPIGSVEPQEQLVRAEEKKSTLSSLLSNVEPRDNELDRLPERASSWTRLLRSMAYIFRGVTPRKKRADGPIRTCEYERAARYLIKRAQEKEFKGDLQRLRSGSAPSDRLVKLSPFIDEHGLLRVGGRIGAAQLPEETKHPMLIPGSSKIAVLIAQFYHEKFGHASTMVVQNMISRRYWILSCRRTIKKVIYSCVPCFKQRPRMVTPKMSDLPDYRVNQTLRPFIKTGVDMAGPIMIKNSLLRRAQQTKAYLCVFVCLTVKAVHLELTSSLTTEAFLGALDRFTARRGLCSDIYSDNGSNFIGAERDLRRFMSERGTQDDIANHLAPRGIQWHWTPPYSPHFGGIWESAVKSAKTNLFKIIGNQVLTFEELSTILARVEACLNSRPLVPMSSDPNDMTALTPGHFLVFDALLAPPEENVAESPINHVQRWNLVKRCQQIFWKRWSQEYLTTLQNRLKWHRQVSNLQPGTLVLMKEDDTPPLAWRLGRITQTFPGKDGVVRVAEVRTVQLEGGKIVAKIFKRPIVKLAPLPNEA